MSDSIIPRGSRCDICMSRLKESKSDGIICTQGHRFIVSTTRHDDLHICPTCGSQRLEGSKNICPEGHTWLIKSPTDYILHHCK